LRVGITHQKVARDSKPAGKRGQWRGCEQSWVRAAQTNTHAQTALVEATTPYTIQQHACARTHTEPARERKKNKHLRGRVAQWPQLAVHRHARQRGSTKSPGTGRCTATQHKVGVCEQVRAGLDRPAPGQSWLSRGYEQITWRPAASTQAHH